MSIQSEITRITNNVQDTIDVIEQTGVSIPAGANSDNLPSLAQALANEKQDKLTGSQGQFVGFTADNVVGAMDAPSGLPTGGTPGQMLYQGASGPEWGDKPVMYVTVTGSSADKTSEEIYQAFQNGYAVFAVLPEDGNVVVPLQSAIEIEQGSYGLIFRSFTESREIVIQIINNSGNGDVVITNSIKIDANDIDFTPGATGLTAKTVQDAIEEVNEKIPAKPIYRTVTLPASGWSSNTQTVTVSGVLADETAQLIQPMPAVASQAAYYAAGILCTNQAANSLTFTCQTVPTEDLTVYVVIQEVTA